MGAVAFVLHADRESVREAELRSRYEVRVTLVGAKADAGEGIERSLFRVKVFLCGDGIAGVAGADSLHSRACVDGRRRHRFLREAHGRERAKRILFPKVRDTKSKIVIDGVPQKRFRGGDGAWRVHHVEEPFAFFRGRTGRVSSGDSQRTGGLALLRLGRGSLRDDGARKEHEAE